MIKLKNIIKESPDSLNARFGDDYVTYIWPDYSSYAFGYYSGKFYIEAEKTHGSLGAFNKKGDEVYRENFTYPGRIWPTKKIISFWKYPKNRKMLDRVFVDINKNTELNINPNEWYIDVMLDSNSKKTIKKIISKGGIYNYSKLVDADAVLIPVKDYDGSMDNNMNIQHMISPIVKAIYGKEVPEGWGSKKRPDDLTATQRHQMRSTSEQKNK